MRCEARRLTGPSLLLDGPGVVLEASLPQGREEAVIAREARVVEEISIRQKADVRQETIHDTVRRTKVEVEDERSRVEGVDPDRLRDEITRER